MRLRTAILIGAACLCQALATPTQDFEFYQVKGGESLEDIASSRGLKPETLRRLNPNLEHIVFPEEGSVIFVPTREQSKRRSLASRSSRAAAAAPKAGPQSPPAETASAVPAARPGSDHGSRGMGLSPDEVDLIFETVVQRHRGVVEEMGEPLAALPSHQNRMVTSDGRTLAVPTAPRKVKVTPAKAADEGKEEQLSPRGQRVVKLLKESFRYLGVPYVWGGEDASGMDCSGFTQKVFCDRGMYIPRTADVQFEVGQVVPQGQEQPGDLVFFETYCPGPSHVGIYLGRHQFVHASSGAGYITFGDLRDDYFSRCYLGARRNW